MKEKIIQAIKNFDIASLNELLDDAKPYQDVPKPLFLERLEMKFNRAKRDDCYSFDDVFFGICGACNKGCEGMTFLSNAGCYLDLFIESKNGVDVDDIYVCNQLTNFTSLNKELDLSFQFYKDQEVLFKPGSDYIFIKEQYQLINSELHGLDSAISLREFLRLVNNYNSLFHAADELHPLSGIDYQLYSKVFRLRSDIEDVSMLKTFKEESVDALIDYQLAKSERDQLIWFYKYRKTHDEIIYNDLPKNWRSDSIASFKIGSVELSINISGYEFVLDYLENLKQFFDNIMEKYRPTKEHFKQSKTRGIEYSLENHLRLHNVHLDVVETHRREKY